ncbi:MAG: YdcF family protein, partial [Cyanobacteria bacterium P01_A01_bin.105]
MLDTPACSTIGTTKQWLQFTSLAGQVVSHPAMVLLVVGLGVMIGMTLGRQRRRRWAVRFGLGFLVAAVVLPVLTTVSLVSLIPADQGQTADAVVILGRGPDLRYLRTAVAADLVKAQRAPMIFVSGGGDAVEMLDILQTHYAVADGVTASLAGEDCSRTTKENALYSAQLLLPQGIKRIILVTDAPHMLRSHLTFRNVGFEVISHPSPFPESFGLQDQMV